MGRILEGFVRDLSENTEGPEDIKEQLLKNVTEASVLSADQLVDNIERAFREFADRNYVTVSDIQQESPVGGWQHQVRFLTMVQLEERREVRADWVVKAQSDPPVEAKVEVVYPDGNINITESDQIDLANEDWDRELNEMVDEVIRFFEDKIADIGQVAEDVIQEFTDRQASRTHSTPRLYEHELPDWVHEKNLDWKAVANFGDYYGVNGQVQQDSPDLSGYENLSGLGGRIPTTEEELPGEHVIESVLEEAGVEVDSRLNYELAVEVLANGYGYDKDLNMVYWTTSGSASVYVEETDEDQ